MCPPFSVNHKRKEEGRRKKEEGRRKKEEGRRRFVVRTLVRKNKEKKK
ncbi:MAG: hypothetical protein JGK27_05535 [Microcoleus sp. PH2017_20_SFW_D_A]|nr:hypothetical protein [Microcoleus sp. PH2017_19_SFW_U_A]MCC3521198.1 hypothetical protein [Microcoleus sp. PH2017_20_SFW_D_A]MCC3552216.1 hypothetical protein [Microcoleus sp. PH2017_35_SFW_U_B]